MSARSSIHHATAYLTACAGLLTLAMSGAEARPDVRTMSCQQVANYINSNGPVVMNTGTHTFQRFVPGFGYCDAHERPAYTWTQTKDTQKCKLIICRNRSSDLFGDSFSGGFGRW